ncbi:hypothetical protein OG252_50510 [Streptomyces sp. NBC_01352]|uniref:Uncharacterized protein n=1 Tax=Streptomyces plumbiresistens TaxID=511811 RepID=A0ABP7U1U1_9ACTN|nr:hypothetical protein [Streptomyces sp. NBC_01352]
MAAWHGKRLRPGVFRAGTQFGLDAQQAAPLGGALGACGGADLDLAGAAADRQIRGPVVLGFAGPGGQDGPVTGGVGLTNDGAGGVQRAGLVGLDQYGVRDPLGDAAAESVQVGDEEVVPQQLPACEPLAGQ